MATFSADSAVDFNNDLFLLQLLTDQATFSNKTNAGFTATSNDLFPSTVEVDGVFPLTSPVVGAINSLFLSINPTGENYNITGLNLLLSDLVAQLNVSTAAGVAKVFENADLIAGSGQDDVLSGFNGEDIIAGNGGNDELFGGNANDDLFGGVGNDELFGGNHSDDLFGEGDNDTLNGGFGGDNLDGGAGRDIADYTEKLLNVSVTLNGATAATVFVNGLAEDSVKNIESVYGGSGSDTLTGDGLVNVFKGGGGADTLNGGAGVDTMFGGAGDDTYIVDRTGDTASEAGGGGADSVFSSASYTLGLDIENLVLTGTAKINATGNASGNTLQGTVAANKLDGAGGADAMLGFAGSDTYIVDDLGDVANEALGTGNDLVRSSVNFSLSDAAHAIGNIERLTLTGTGNIDGTGNSLKNVIVGNSGDNGLNGRAGADTIHGGKGNDKMKGGAGADKLNGDLGNDVLDGGVGADTLAGGKGNDTYRVDSKLDKVVEAKGPGIDTVLSSVTFSLASKVENLTLTGNNALNGTGNGLDNIIKGNGAGNTLNGGLGNDILQGLAGNDTLFGGAGRDKVTGGTGDDRMSGGAANDTFFFAGSFGKDTITDFSAGVGIGDVVSIDKDFVANFAAVLNQASVIGGNVVLTIDAQHKITFANLDQVSDLHANDFLFV